MIDLINELYGLNIIGFIKVTQKVYKIKDQNQFYYLKICNDIHLEEVIDYISSIHLECFVDVIKNKYDNYITKYNDHYFYLMKELIHSTSHLKELKIKHYFEMLAYIHTHSCYNLKVNQEYFKQVYNDTLKIINERIYYYDDLMSKYEVLKYKSPSQWLFVLNYQRIIKSLKEAVFYLKKYMICVENKNSIRVSLIYKHFHYEHIFLKNKKLISLDRMKIDLPIYDIYDIYQRLPDILFDLDCFSDSYLKIMNLNDDEVLLLSTLLKIIPVIYLENDEINNIIKLSRLLYYIDSIDSLCLCLDRQKDGDFH